MAAILSTAMMLLHTFDLVEPARRIEAAVAATLAAGIRGADLGGRAGTRQIGDAVLERLA
jgi:3-isopropylmalate dehydrogenase